MCGVFGLVWNADAGVSSAPAALAAQAMQRALDHRGPDGTGIFARDGVVLGHVRLSIIDLVSGAQPMANDDDTVVLSYNGEIYNFPQLNPALEARGWAFHTRSDSETVLASYCLDGAEADEVFNGMYAYAVLDDRVDRHVVMLATDPVGIKPLFLWTGDGLSLFASELQALIAGLKALGIAPALNHEAISAYLELGWVPAPMTLVEGARRLLPGERWEIDRRTAAARLTGRREISVVSHDPADQDGFRARLREALQAAVRRQMISDVPLGLFLSGGIDSSLIAAIAREQGFTGSCFTIGFTGDGHGVAQADEAEVARSVARHLGLGFHCIEVDEQRLLGALDQTFAAMDQPLADPACLPLLLLAGFARQSVKVCMSGDGGDELLAGYPRHRMAAMKARWARLPRPVRGMAAFAARQLPTAPRSGPQETLRKARVGYELLASPSYIDGPFAAFIGPSPHAAAFNGRIESDSLSLFKADINGQLAGQMLPKTDNMTMAASLECRVPLLDLELAALAAAAPLAWKRAGALGKLPLRAELTKYLPPEITNRPKRGFRVPLTSWFRAGLEEQIRSALVRRGPLLDHSLGPGVAERVVAEHLAGRAEHSIRLWALLALDSWLCRFEEPPEMNAG